MNMYGVLYLDCSRSIHLPPYGDAYFLSNCSHGMDRKWGEGDGRRG